MPSREREFLTKIAIRGPFVLAIAFGVFPVLATECTKPEGNIDLTTTSASTTYKISVNSNCQVNQLP